jgi:hypothetical protein
MRRRPPDLRKREPLPDTLSDGAWRFHATRLLSTRQPLPFMSAVSLTIRRRKMIRRWANGTSSQLTREVYLEAVPSDMKNAVQNVEDLLIGPKRTQVPVWPEMKSFAIN